MAMAPALRHRLRAKTAQPLQVPLAEPPSVLEEPESTTGRRSTYLITFPHPQVARSQTGVLLVAPEALTRADILGRVRAACEKPDYQDAKSIAQAAVVRLKFVSVWAEKHAQAADGVPHGHFHVALLAARLFRFLPVKRALLLRFGLATHWSCTHDGYWSAMRYVAIPSPKKPANALDKMPLLWASEGEHPAVEACCHEPATAAAVAAKRRRAEVRAAELGKSAPRVTEFDLWPVIVRAGIHNGEGRTAHLQLMQYVKRNCPADICAFVFKIRARLNSLIDDVWDWEQIDEVLAVAQQTRAAAVAAAARQPCVCGGQWPGFAVGALVANGLDVAELCRDVYNALVTGRSETTRVVVLAGAAGGEGKSFFQKGVASIFAVKDVFHSPARGSFPLLGLETAKVAILDDWRFTEEIVTFALQCLWYDGSAVPIARPQNQAAFTGHLLYRGSAPIFATTKLQDIDRLRTASEPNPSTGVPGDGNASMILRRLKVFAFPLRVPPPPTHVPCCPRCCAQLLLAHGTCPAEAGVWV